MCYIYIQRESFRCPQAPHEGEEPAKMDAFKFPFLLGEVLNEKHVAGNEHVNDDNTLLVEWYVPGTNKPHGAGRRKDVADIFGIWKPYVAMDLRGARTVQLPSIIVPRVRTLLGNVQLEEGGMIPFECFDRLRADYSIDCSGVDSSWSPRGMAYRTHCIMRRQG